MGWESVFENEPRKTEQPAVARTPRGQWTAMVPELTLPELARLVEIAANGNFQAREFAVEVLKRALQPPTPPIMDRTPGETSNTDAAQGDKP